MTVALGVYALATPTELGANDSGACYICETQGGTCPWQGECSVCACYPHAAQEPYCDRGTEYCGGGWVLFCCWDEI